MSLAIFFSLPVKMFPAVQALERRLVPRDAPRARAALCVGLAPCRKQTRCRPASAAQAAGWPRWAGAWGSLGPPSGAGEACVAPLWPNPGRIPNLVCDPGPALSAAALALLLPDFGFLVSIVGALCMGLIAFVLPPAIYLALEARQTDRRRAGGRALLYLPLGNARARGGRAGRPAVAAHVALLVLGLIVTVGATGKVLADKLHPSS